MEPMTAGSHSASMLLVSGFTTHLIGLVWLELQALLVALLLRSESPAVLLLLLLLVGSIALPLSLLWRLHL